MRAKSFLIALAVLIGSAVPAMAQQSGTLHRYVAFFAYTDQTIKNLTDHPQDRTAAVNKIAEQFGGKLETLYLFPFGGEFDGIGIFQVPTEAAMEDINLVWRSSGSFIKLVISSAMTPAEYKTLLEGAKQGAPSYAAPGR